MWKSGWGNFEKTEGEEWRRILCGFVERVCGMAEDIVRRGCGGMGERWSDGAEWRRENGRKAEERCGMVEGECGMTEGRYGQGGEVNSKGNLGGLLKIYL